MTSTVPHRLKQAEIKVVRERQLSSQGGCCALCGLPLSQANARLDHDHSTGAVRGTLHNGCNAMLGKIENGAARFGLRDIAAFGRGLGPYLNKHAVNVTGYLHPTHKTEDEKRERRNAQARKRRAAARPD